MFRVKYLYGLLAFIFGMLCHFLAYFALHNTLRPNDIIIVNLIGAILESAGTILFIGSYRDYKTEKQYIHKTVQDILSNHSSITAEQLADMARIPLGDAREYLQYQAPKENMVVVQTKDGRKVRAFSPHSLN